MREIRDNLERKKRDYLEKSEGGGATSSREGECKLSEAEEDVLASLRRDLSKKRDSQLKSEIRRIETESALADKESRARVAEERSRAEEAMAAEERQLRRKQVGRVFNGLCDLWVFSRPRLNDVCYVLTFLPEHVHRSNCRAECAEEPTVWRDQCSAGRADRPTGGAQRCEAAAPGGRR